MAARLLMSILTVNHSSLASIRNAHNAIIKIIGLYGICKATLSQAALSNANPCICLFSLSRLLILPCAQILPNIALL